MNSFWRENCKIDTKKAYDAEYVEQFIAIIQDDHFLKNEICKGLIGDYP